MNISQKQLAQISLMPPTIDEISKYSSPKIIFPFNEPIPDNEVELTIAKILMVNFYESTRVQNRHIESLAMHIIKVLNKENYVVLRKGVINQEYFNLVEKISSGHGCKTNDTNTVEDKMLSFSSKFCAHHNQKLPFYDKYVFEILKFWVKEYGIKLLWKDYEGYVSAFIELQKQQHLEDFSLRHIESYVWNIADKLKKT